MTTRPYPRGIRRTAYGWQVYARRDGRLQSKHFPAATSLDTLKREREKLIGRAVLQLAPASGQSFADDARAYLALVRSMPTYTDRAYRIRCWVDVFGPRARKDITARDIRTQLEQWRLSGSHLGGALSPASLNQRRTALMHLYTVLDGKSAANIVKDVPPYDERDSEQIRAQPLVVCARVIRHLRYWGKMRARLHVLMWTGWPHQLLKQITPDDIDWTHGRVRLARRKKGKGMPALWVPIVPQALRALRRFHALDCYGPFSNSSMHSAVARGVRAENRRRARLKLPLLPPMRAYDLRHAFATWAASKIRDDRALKELLRTNSIERYTHGAMQQRLEAARDSLKQGAKVARELQVSTRTREKARQNPKL